MPIEGDQPKPSNEPSETKKVIFLGGSLGITTVPVSVRERFIRSIIKNGHRVVVGDAPGADLAFQRVLKEAGHEDVIVFHSGKTCRNNVGFPDISVPVPPNVTGRDFYAVKDQAMVKMASAGLFLWDGRSKGTLRNMVSLIERGKKVFVHVNGTSHKLESEEDLKDLLRKLGMESDTISLRRIEGFFGENRWLSNFWPAKVTMDGMTYPTVEHAYQAAKFSDLELRKRIAKCISPAEAKRLARQLVDQVRKDWDSVKDETMEELVTQKFTSDPVLKERLLSTGDAELVETNTWGDTYWGVYQGKGQNKLGKILMKVRQRIEKHETPKN